MALASHALLGPRLDGLSVDFLHWLQAVRAPAAASSTAPVVVIAIDEETHRREPFKDVPTAFWTREIGSVLDKVVAGGATAVGFDVIFPTTVQAFVPGFDREFLVALRNAARQGKVVLGKAQHQTDPVAPFRGQLVAVGMPGERNLRSVNLFTDPDGIIRRIPLFFERDDDAARREPSMSLELAARHLGVRPEPRADGTVLLAGRPIPDGRDGNLLLRFPAPLSRIVAHSFADLAACAAADRDAFFRRHFEGRVVLIGTFVDVEDRKITSARLATLPEDAHRAPRCAIEPMPAMVRTDVVRPTIPGVFVHAAAVANLLQGDALREPPPALAAALIALLALAGAAVAMRFTPAIAGAAAAMLAVLAIAGAWLAFAAGLVLPLVSGTVALVVAFGTTIAWRIVITDREKRLLRRSFSLYLAPSLVDGLAESETPPRLGGEAREITAMFCDLVGFTTLSEEKPAERVVEIINAYFSAMTEIVEREGGFVDKFVGDAIVAVFGAPVALPDHAHRAVRAALAFQTQLDQLNATVFCDRPLGQRIGIATGQAIVGNIGSRRRFNYTAIGDVMNLASRLEAANKEHGTRILCAEETRQAAGDGFAWTEVARIAVRGRRASVTVFEPSPAPPG